jgi:hypothetical protein
MRWVSVLRSSGAWTVTSLAILAAPFGLSAPVAAEPPPTSATTTTFQAPVTFVSACSTVGFRCWVPYLLAVVTPSATTGAPGMVTFAAEPSTTIAITTLDCIDVSVNWRNLTTGAAGTTVLHTVQPVDFSRPVGPGERCRYTPATVGTGSGMVIATADVNAHVLPPASDRWPQMPVTPGFGSFPVP